MTRWKLTIEYDGTPYAGWQRQDKEPSIQQSIEEAITAFCQQDIRIHAAGRTDTGVHALGQVAHFDLNYPRPLTGFNLAKAINAHLVPQPVTIITAEKVADDFHARFNAMSKRYVYRLLTRSAPPALDKGRVWHVFKNLNADAMREAAAHLVGKHDFTTFRATACQAKSPVRTLDRLEIEEHDYPSGGKELRFIVDGRSFLHHQVRNIVGTLKLVGEGKWQPENVKLALEAKDRAEGGPTAPPEGLYLKKIDYK